MMIKNCKSCKKEFKCRVADHKRGWGKFCSKSCKAKHQEARNGGQYAKTRYYAREYGGIPNFDRNGDYIGFQCTGFSNEE